MCDSFDCHSFGCIKFINFHKRHFCCRYLDSCGVFAAPLRASSRSRAIMSKSRVAYYYQCEHCTDSRSAPHIWPMCSPCCVAWVLRRIAWTIAGCVSDAGDTATTSRLLGVGAINIKQVSADSSLRIYVHAHIPNFSFLCRGYRASLLWPRPSHEAGAIEAHSSPHSRLWPLSQVGSLQAASCIA